MSDFINLVLSAYDPNSQTHEAAQNELISIKYKDPNALIDEISENIQISDLDEKAIIYLLILSREAFFDDSNESDEQICNRVSPDVLSKYESVLIERMNDQNEKIRFHASMSFGHFGYYYIFRNTEFLSHMFELFNNEEMTNNFITSFEKSLLYILKQDIILSNGQSETISHFIFSRLTIEDSLLINEKKLCLQLLLQLSPDFLTFFTDDEKKIIFQFFKDFSTIRELSFYSFLVLSSIMDKSPSSISHDLFDELMEISIQVITDIENETDNLNTDNRDLNDMTKFEIFRFWDYSIYSECDISLQVPPYLPKLAEFALKNLFVPGLEDDNDNLSTDCSTALLSCLVLSYPNESAELFELFIQTNYQNQTEQSNSLFDYKDQYDCFVLVILFLKSGFFSFLEMAVEMVQIGLDSPIDQLKIVGLRIISQLVESYIDLLQTDDFCEEETVLSQIDFTSYLPICLNFFKTDVSQLQLESSQTINSIISMVFSTEQEWPNFNIIDLIGEITDLIQLDVPLSQVYYCLSLLNDTIKYIKDSDDILNIFQFTFQFTSELFESNPDDSLIGTLCKLLSTILVNGHDWANSFDLLSQLFELLLNILNTENGNDAVVTIGYISFALGDKFQPMLNEAISAALQLIDDEQFVRSSFMCLRMVISSCDSTFAIEDIVPRIFHILDDANSSGNDFIISYHLIKTVVLLYYNFLVQISESDLLPAIVKYLNVAVESLGEMFEEDKEVASSIAYAVFEVYSFLLKSDFKKYFHLISNRFFILISLIISACGIDEIETKFIAQLIDMVNFLAMNYGDSIHDVLKKSRILDFLNTISEMYEKEDENDNNVKSSIEQIFSIVCKENE